MVKRVALFQAADGQTFDTEKAAVEHEAKVAITAGVAKFLAQKDLTGTTVNIGESDMVMLDTFLIDNRAELVAVLSGAVKVKKERKPRQPRQTAAPVAPVEPTAPVVTEDAAPVQATVAAEPIAVAARADDDMLNELLAEAGN